MGDSISARAYAGPDNPETSLTLDARILEPGDVCNVYVWDAAAAALRLQRIIRPARPRGADLARLPLLSSFGESARAASQAAAMEGHGRRFRFGERVMAATSPPESALAGPGLVVLLLADPPNPPGVWVRTRVVGAWRPARAAADVGVTAAAGGPTAVADTLDAGDAAATAPTLRALGQWTLIAVPHADERLTAVAELRDLPAERRSHLTRALLSLGACAGDQGEPLGEWLAAREAFDLCNRARLLARRTGGSDAAEGTPGTPSGDLRRRGADDTEHAAWHVLSGLTPAELRAFGAGAYAAAEHVSRLVPARFRHYLDELLMPSERVLCFAERAAIRRRPDGIRAFLPGQHGVYLAAGLLLVTERQVLCLRDFAPPDATLIEWGYLARSYPLGRMVGAALLPPGTGIETGLTPRDIPGLPPTALPAAVAAGAAADPETRRELACDHLARLVIFVEARGGMEVGAMAMPAAAIGGLDWAATLLRRFAPRQGSAAAADQRIRPVPAVAPWRPSDEELAALEGLGGEIAAPLRAALDDALARALADGENSLVVARAADPAASGGGQSAAHLLALTPRRLIAVRARRAARAAHSAAGAARVETTVTSVPVGALSSAALQHSLLGCALWARRPARSMPTSSRPDSSAEAQMVTVGFASPAITSFHALFVRLSALLGGPSSAGAWEE
jgi:hypothetical protein